MARLVTTENPSEDVRRYLRHWAAPDFVRARLLEQDPALGADRRRTKARQVAVLLEQGLEFLESADRASSLTKPLALYYAAENFGKALCICRASSTDMSSFGHHGLSGDRHKRYSVHNLQCRVRNRRDGVWQHVFSSFNSDRLRFSVRADDQGITRDVVLTHSTPPLANGATLLLGDLLRHMPELAEDVVLAGWGHPFVVHASVLMFTQRSGPPTVYSGALTVRHGHRQATRDMVVARERRLLPGWRRTYDDLDSLKYERALSEDSVRFPDGRLDVFGEPYLDFSSSRRVLGELPLYVGALFILSDVVRYQADQWLRLLKDHPAEAVLIDRFLAIAVRKLPNLVLNELSQDLVLFRLAH